MYTDSTSKKDNTISTSLLESPFLILRMHTLIQDSNSDIGRKIGYVIALILFIIPILLVDGLVAFARHFVTATILNKSVKNQLKKFILNVINDDLIIDRLKSKILEIIKSNETKEALLKLLSNEETTKSVKKLLTNAIVDPKIMKLLKNKVNKLLKDKLVQHDLSSAMHKVVKKFTSTAIQKILLSKIKVSKKIVPDLIKRIMKKIEKRIAAFLKTLTSACPDKIHANSFNVFNDLEFIREALNPIINKKFNASQILYNKLERKIRTIELKSNDSEIKNFILYNIYKIIKEVTKKIASSNTSWASNRIPKLNLFGKTSKRWKEIANCFEAVQRSLAISVKT